MEGLSNYGARLLWSEQVHEIHEVDDRKRRLVYKGEDGAVGGCEMYEDRNL